jgi:hypothetical protein
MELVNPLLLLIFLAEICFVVCAGRSPQFLRRLAAYLLVRADVVELCDREGERRKRFWLEELKVSRVTRASEKREHAPSVQLFSGR